MIRIAATAAASAVLLSGAAAEAQDRGTEPWEFAVTAVTHDDQGERLIRRLFQIRTFDYGTPIHLSTIRQLEAWLAEAAAIYHSEMPDPATNEMSAVFHALATPAGIARGAAAVVEEYLGSPLGGAGCRPDPKTTDADAHYLRKRDSVVYHLVREGRAHTAAYKVGMGFLDPSEETIVAALLSRASAAQAFRAISDFSVIRDAYDRICAAR